MFKKIFLCILCLAFVCLGFGCEKEPEKPDFGEPGTWEYSEKLSLGFGANEGGLSMEEYVVRADEGIRDWPEKASCVVLLNEELIMGDEKEFTVGEKQTNAFLSRMKRHELLIREAYELAETGDASGNQDYRDDVQHLFAYGCKEFLGFEWISGVWEISAGGGYCLLASSFNHVRTDLMEDLIRVSESPLVELVIFGYTAVPEFSDYQTA